MQRKHLDEARAAAISAMEALLEAEQAIERAVLIDDLFGNLRAVLWGEPKHEAIVSEQLRSAAGPFWSNDVWMASQASETDRLVYDRAWKEATPRSERLRVLDRVAIVPRGSVRSPSRSGPSRRRTPTRRSSFSTPSRAGLAEPPRWRRLPSSERGWGSASPLSTWTWIRRAWDLCSPLTRQARLRAGAWRTTCWSVFYDLRRPLREVALHPM